MNSGTVGLLIVPLSVGICPTALQLVVTRLVHSCNVKSLKADGQETVTSAAERSMSSSGTEMYLIVAKSEVELTV